MHHAARMSDEHLSELVAAFAAQLGAAGFALRELVVSKGDSPHYRSQPHVVVYNAPSSPSTGTRKRPREGPSAAPTLQIVRRKQAPQQQQLHSHAAQDVATVVSEGAALAPTGAVRQQPSPHVQQMVAPPAHHAYYAGAPYYQLAALPHAPMIRPYPLAGPQNMYWSTVLNNGGAPAAPAQPSPSAPPPQATPSAVPRAISAQLPCPRCDAKFGQKSNLNKHIRTVHENRRPFVCDRCPSTFGHKNLLVEHVRTAHDGERPFVCDQCGVSFGRRSNKYQHVQMVHIKRRSFQCQICAMTFGLKGNLSKHVRLVHEKQRPYACDLCDSCFGLKSDLKRHKATVHANSPNPLDHPAPLSTATTAANGCASGGAASSRSAASSSASAPTTAPSTSAVVAVARTTSPQSPSRAPPSK